MRRTISNRNFFPSSSASAASGGSTSRSGPQQPPDDDQINNNNNGARAGVTKLIAENAIVIICVRQCCMCLMLMHLLKGLGANPKIFEIEEAETEATLEELSKIRGGAGGGGGGGPKKLPVVYLGGELLGGVEKVVEIDIKKELIPMLKDAGALWL